MAKESVYKHENVGYCKKKAKCMILHPTDECDDKCKLKLHPLKDTEKKTVSTEMIVNIKNVNSNMTRNQIQMINYLN